MHVDLPVVLILAIPVLLTVYRLGQWREARRMRTQMRHVERSKYILRQLLKDDHDK